MVFVGLWKKALKAKDLPQQQDGQVLTFAREMVEWNGLIGKNILMENDFTVSEHLMSCKVINFVIFFGKLEN